VTVRRFRHRPAMKELEERQKHGERYGLHPDNMQHPSMHIKPAERSMYDWSDSQRETVPAHRLLATGRHDMPTAQE